MPRPRRKVEPDICYHVLNRGNARQRLFHKAGDYAAFVEILEEGLKRFDIELLCWCVMPNHWHLVLMPGSAKAMPEFMRWVTVTHVRRHHQHYESPPGHLYQGRYKSFPVADDHHFLLLCRYVEANPRRAKLETRAERWKWSSLHQRAARERTPQLSAWPIARPASWLDIVNEAMPEAERQAVREAIERERPLGSDSWIKQIAAKLGLQQSLRPRGRPRKPAEKLSPRERQRRAAEKRQKGA